MRYIYDDNTEKLINALNNRINEITFKHTSAMEQELKPLQDALMKVKLNNKPVRTEMTEHDKIELQQMKESLK